MVKQFVVDFTSKTYKPLMEHEVNGLDYRYVYSDKARLSVVIQGIENGSASLLDANGELHAYYHCDYLGTTDYLTSAVNSKVISWTSYNEWGEITHNAVLKCGQRELDLVKEYATHDFDAMLNQYYAKARFYDADNRRFTAVDPIKDGLIWYAYCGSNPANRVDLNGEKSRNIVELAKEYGASITWKSSGKTVNKQNLDSYLKALYSAEHSKYITSSVELSATVTLNGQSKTYAVAKNSYMAAPLHVESRLFQNGYDVMIDDLSFAHDWNYAYNRAYESSIVYSDGYITNQNAYPFTKMRYGVTTMNGVACELIAIYNALVKVGFSVPISEIADYYEHNPGMWNSGNWGTEYWRIDDYFQKYRCIDVEKVNLMEIENKLTDDNACILSFNNPNSARIHTVMVIRNGNAFTAYNLGDNGTVIRNSIAEILSYDGRNRHFISAYIISDRHFSKKTVAV